MKDRAHEEKKIVKEASLLSFARYFSEFLLAIRGFVIARFLGPSMYGIWNMFTSTLNLSSYANLGVNSGLNRELPLHIGKKDEVSSHSLIQTSLTWSLLTSLLLSLATIVLLMTGSFKDYRTEVLIFIAVLVTRNVYMFLQIKLNAEQKNTSLAKNELFYGLFNTLFGLGLLFFIEIKGLLIGMVLTYSLIVFLSWKKNNIIFQLLLQKKNLGQLIKTGFPIMMLTMTFFLMHNIDKYLIFYLLGSTMTGYYGLAEFITTMMHNVPYGISQVLFPRMMQKFGRTKDKKQIEEYFTIPMQLLTFATPIALGLIFINMEWLLTLALPKYLPSLLTIKILVLGIFFSAIMKTPLDIIILMNKQKVTLIIQFIILFLGAVADYFVIKAGYGISGVAMVTTLTFCVSAIIMVAYASKLLEYPVQKTSFEISKLLGSFVYLLVILFLSTSASALGVSPMYSILLTNLFFIILIIPYILLLNKNDLLKKIFQSLRRGT